LTTIGWSFFASVTKSGELLDGAEALFAKNPPESSVFLPEQPNPIPVIKNAVQSITALRVIFPFQEKKKNPPLCKSIRKILFLRAIFLESAYNVHITIEFLSPATKVSG